jgi:prostaglandin-E synthase
MQAPIIWAQRKDKVLVTINVLDITDQVLKIEDGKFVFSGKSGDKSYTADLELFGEIIQADSHFVVRHRGLEIALAKKDKAVWWPRLAKTTSKLHYVSVDWNRWVDSSEDEDAKPGFNFNPDEMGDLGGPAGDDSSDDDLEDVPPETPGTEPDADGATVVD